MIYGAVKALQMEQRVLKPFQDYFKTVLGVWGLNAKGRGPRVARYILRGMCNPVAASQWSSALHDKPELRLWFSHSPRLVLKPTRPYMRRDRMFAERVEVIASHYTQLARLFSQHNVVALANGHSLLLAEFSGKHGGSYRINLRKTDKFDREGELIICLRDASRHRDVYHLVFSLSVAMHSPCMEIGCIQGPSGEDAREVVKATTKELMGIRPRDLLIEASMSLAKAWNVTELFGVSNEVRVCRPDSTFADYDALWAEIGAIPDRNGMFRFPNALKHHNLAEVPSHHRSEYRKRIALRADLAGQIAAATISLQERFIR